MKALYIYAGSRRNLQNGTLGRDAPDTQFYGLNHMQEFDISATYKEPEECFPRLIGRALGFRGRHFFMFFATRTYDIVFGSALLYMLLWKKIIPTKTKFVLFNISTNRIIEASQMNPLRRKLIQWLLKEVDAVVCLSHAHAERFKDLCPVLAQRTHVVLLGVDTSFYEPQQKREDVFLAVGRDNGRDYASVVEVARRMPERTFEIVCSERNMKGITDIPSNITVYYDIPYGELKRKYESSRALLLLTHPDRFNDGADCSGQTVLLEAMASGLPVIATEKAYMSDYVTRGYEVLLVPAYDHDAIESAIRMLNDDEYRDTLSHNARIRAEALSTIHMADALSKVFVEITDNNK